MTWSRIILFGLLVMCLPAQADSWVHRTDLEIAAIVPEIGFVAWSYRPPRLGAATLALYKQGLVVEPKAESAHREKPIYLDPDKGWAIKPFKRGKAIASSLKRPEERSSAVEASFTWTLDYSNLDDESNIRDLSADMRIYDGMLYLRHHATLYAFDAQTGREQWRFNMARELHLNRGDFSPEMELRNEFARVGNTLMLIFSKRIVAFDMTSHQVIWQMETDAFPSMPTFLAYKDTLLMLVGCQRKIHLPEHGGQ